ncbi:glutathione S-transferase 1-like isoform X2 [Neodiprion fabricii]|uniref:glutathione S-transferase 1-like isoform X2 n=1 Tax=Neodiprion fabricii TaxID=2872261 RepID=UPI001ED9398B|nr:glutathione S-transferase 1-like isoform X2 [Neodiprion fabricii]
MFLTIQETKMTPPILYSTDASPPCRGVLLAVAAAGIKLNVQEIHLMDGEHRKEEFLKMNPQHTLPTLDDDGFHIWDSHAIVTYLFDKYAKDDSMYPKDLQKRAVINQRLHFDNSILFPAIREIAAPILYKGVTEIPQDRIDFIKQNFEFLEIFLGNSDWMAGNTLTLADTSIIASVTSLMVFVPLDQYPKLAAWVKRCEDKIPGYAKANTAGVKIFHNLFGKFFSKA